MKKVTAIGGVLFKSKDPEQTREWYNKHLGIASEKWGAMFEWRDAEDPEKKGATAWNSFPETSKYFDGPLMINYCVENMDELVEQLRKDGVTIVDNIEDSDFGKFVHILDNEGRKVQLWEPK
jgi:lactoylglutathione lyase